jgi:transposase InsO family protein
MTAFIEKHREDFGVEPICRVRQIGSATFHRHAAIARNPELASQSARQDAVDLEKIKATHGKSRGRYGARKVWHQLRRNGHDIARCTVELLMPLHEFQGVVRGQKKTTIPDAAQPCPDDKVNRQFVAAMPNQLWVSDFTYVST